MDVNLPRFTSNFHLQLNSQLPVKRGVAFTWFGRRCRNLAAMSFLLVCHLL